MMRGMNALKESQNSELLQIEYLMKKALRL
jgi:hypothetical protein